MIDDFGDKFDQKRRFDVRGERKNDRKRKTGERSSKSRTTEDQHTVVWNKQD